VATIRRATIATALVIVGLLSAPGPSTADPVGSALGGVTQGLLDESGAQVTVGGGGLPQVTVGVGGGQDATTPAPGAPATQPQQPAGSSPSSAPSGATRESAPAPKSAGSDRQGTVKGGGTSRAAPSRSGNTSSSATTRSSAAAARAQEDPGSGAASSARQRSTATPKSSEGSPVARVVNSIPPQFRWLLAAVGIVAALFGLLALHEMRRSRRAHRNAHADGLTGLLNRAGFEQRLAKEWQRAKRYERGLGLLVIDLDDFKQVNDSEGHMAGDRMLRETAAAISGRIRETDVPGRMGGDEFVVLCPETTGAGLETLAVGLERTLEQHGVQASVGHAQREPVDAQPSELLVRADKSMYERKRHRRSRGLRPSGQLQPA
jgi:diguanylate cyclase (GGDEF)-like protein